jgi:arylsulfatase A-like enzyme
MKKSAWVLAAGAAAVQAVEKPNILWIITDDHRPDSWGCYNQAVSGSRLSPLGYVESPAADSLAAEGVLFTQAYCNAPACAPSRASMLTGRYPFRTGIWGFEQTHNKAAHMRPVVPEVMRQNGYAAAHFGKTGYYIFQWNNKNTYNSLNYYAPEINANDMEKNGQTDMAINKPWVHGKQVGTEEIYYFADGAVKRFYTDRGSEPLTETDITTRHEVEKELGILRHYTADNTGLIIGGQSPQTAEKTMDGLIATEMVDYLKTQADKKSPQFIHLGFHFPHTAVLPPREIRDRFIIKEKEIPYTIPPFSTDEVSRMPPQLQLLHKKMNFSNMKEQDKLQAIRDYYAFCAHGDAQVGRCIDAFKKYSREAGRDWLIVYVCGDHSWQLGEQGIESKFSPWQMSTRSAVIAASSRPGLFPAGTVCSNLIEYVDFAPTFLAASGVDLTSGYEHLDGVSLADTAHGRVAPRDYIIGELNHVIGPRAYLRSKEFAFSMRTRPSNGKPGQGFAPGENIRWALDCPRNKAELCLYDLRTDPEERRNVADEPAYVPLADWFRQKLGNIVLGDRRVECDWRKENEWVICDFAKGADDKKLNIPAGLIPTR